MPENLSPYELFKQVFHQYYKPLCQYAFTLLKEQHGPEDIVQEIFLRVWEKKQDLLNKNEIRFYLFTAVRNNCLTSLGKKKKFVLTELTGLEKTSEPIVLAAGKEIETDFGTLLAEALDRLPTKCREVFILSRMSKLTYRQIAETSGISVKTVENQMGKALGIMRSFIKEKQVYFIDIMFFISIFGLTQ